MSLPYGATVQGLTLKWMYDHIAAEVKKFQNAYGKLALADRDLAVGFEIADPRLSARLNVPIARVTFENGVNLANSVRHGETKTIYDPGTIAHTGEGTGDVELTGYHQGNARFVLEILADDNYELRRMPWDGEEWGAEELVSTGEIPESGEIDCENGQTFVINSGEVTEGDAYAWETQAYKVSNVLGKTVSALPRVDIYFASGKEITWTDYNALDQLVVFFPEREFGIASFGGDFVIVLQEVTNVKVQPGSLNFPDGGSWQGVVVSIQLRYQGADNGNQPCLFTADVDPLVRPVIDEVKIPAS